MQTAPLQGIAHLAGVVGGEEDQGRRLGLDGADLGDTNLKGGQ